MNNPSQEKFNKLLNQYKALTVERLEVENVICKTYETQMLNKETTDPTEKLKEIATLKKRLNHINKEITNTDKKMLRLLKQSKASSKTSI